VQVGLLLLLLLLLLLKEVKVGAGHVPDMEDQGWLLGQLQLLERQLSQC
jgi:hypothetical protein